MKETDKSGKLTDNHPITTIFENLPGLYLILSSDFYILNASNAYLNATFTKREEIVGKHLFEVFPDNPDAPEAKAVESLNNSLRTVLSTRIPHVMAIQHYDIPDPNKKGAFIERHWKPVNTPVLCENGQVSYIIHQVTDVTKEVQSALQYEAMETRERDALEEVEFQKNELQKLFEQAPVAITILMGKEYVIELANPAVCELWNRTPLQVTGKPLFEALPEVKGQGLEELLENVVKTGEPFIGKELPVTINRANGLEVVYFNFVYKPFLDNGRVKGILVVASDVSSQVQARMLIEENQKALVRVNNELAAANEEIQATNEELYATNEELFNTQQALNEINDHLEKIVETRTKDLKNRENELENLTMELAASNEELTAANEQITSSMEELSDSSKKLQHINSDMDNFIYTASHDLKAPIANIEGLMSALVKNLSEESKEKAEKIIQLIGVSIARFKKTINDLTEVVKIEKEEDLIESIDIPLIVEEVKSDLYSIIEESNAEILLQGCDLIKVRFSHKNLKSIVYNLLSNAIKYSHPERSPVVKIKCYEENEFRIISFQDNGIGMNLTSETKIFSMFKRLHNHVEGSGIGLYIVKKIIQNAGGKIEVISKVNEGTTFKVYFKA